MIRAQMSVLDRLLDDHPKTREEVPLSVSQTNRNLREAVRRDLEWLLNTRRTEGISEDLEELQASVYLYGLPDFSSYSFGSNQTRIRVRLALEQALKSFEPRLINAIVTPIPTDREEEKRIMRFLISGLLQVEPAPEPVSYETLLEVSRGQYQIRSG